MMERAGYVIEGVPLTSKKIANLFESVVGLHLTEFGFCSALRWVEKTFGQLMDLLCRHPQEYVLILSRNCLLT